MKPKNGGKIMKKWITTDLNNHAAKRNGSVLKMAKQFIAFVLTGGMAFRRRPYMHIVQFELGRKSEKIIKESNTIIV